MNVCVLLSQEISHTEGRENGAPTDLSAGWLSVFLLDNGEVPPWYFQLREL